MTTPGPTDRSEAPPSGGDALASPIRIGVSACLLGQEVRFDGGHKHDPYLTGTLGRYFDWVPVCPEVEAGMGTPRESVRLVGKLAAPRLVAPRSGIDWTDAMERGIRKRLDALETLGLHGFILKKGSPSCGMERVKVYDPAGMPDPHGRGLFAARLLARWPLLPVEEEGRLHDPPLRESFVERVFAHHRWAGFRAGRPRPRDLVQFHARHKMTLLAHSREEYTALGRIVAGAGSGRFTPILDAYGEAFMRALRHRATRRKHANVLYHLLGFLKQALPPEDKAEMGELIEAYRLEQVPLVVPITLLRHHLRRHPVAWALDQTYLNPYPSELMLRNHV